MGGAFTLIEVAMNGVAIFSIFRLDGTRLFISTTCDASAEEACMVAPAQAQCRRCLWWLAFQRHHEQGTALLEERLRLILYLVCLSVVEVLAKPRAAIDGRFAPRIVIMAVNGTM